MMQDLFELPLRLQVILVGGYLGYSVAYAGLPSSRKPYDAAFLTLAFGVIAALTYEIASRCLATLNLDGIVSVGGATLVALLVTWFAGAIWRRKARTWYYDFVHHRGIHLDDGLDTAWEALSQRSGIEFTQIMVRTTEGTELFCEDVMRRIEEAGEEEELAREFVPKLGLDGSITMIVDTEARAGENEVRRQQARADGGWGCRLTYIPANKIEYVELRARRRPTS